jgi:PleD family two-component response regulator
MGGDEFVVLLPNLDQLAARSMAEIMRQAVMDMNIKNPASPHGIITISLGLSCQKPALDD